MVLASFFKVHDAIQVLTEPYLDLPIIMYHNVSKNPNLLGKYTISQEELEKDIIYLKEQGYTTIVVEDLIAFEFNGISLPEKPIMLTFDDGYSNISKYVLPLLEKYDCKAVVSVIGKYVEKSSESNYPDPYLNWTQINELIASVYFQIHTIFYSIHS